jgi:hypothetical protein
MTNAMRKQLSIENLENENFNQMNNSSLNNINNTNHSNRYSLQLQQLRQASNNNAAFIVSFDNPLAQLSELNQKQITEIVQIKKGLKLKFVSSLAPIEIETKA